MQRTEQEFAGLDLGDARLDKRVKRMMERFSANPTVIDWVFGWWQGPNHCVNTYEKEKARYNCPPAMRTPKDEG